MNKTKPTVSRNPAIQRGNEKELHQLRLRLKAIRVQCLLLESTFPEHYPAKSCFSPFREYYRQTSRLRDLTVTLHRFRKICRTYHLSSNGFQKHLWRHYREAEKQLQRIPFPDIDAFEQQHRDEIPRDKLADSISQQIHQLMEKVLAAHHDSGIASHLHWQRKQLKKLIYLFRQLPDNPKEWKSSITIKLENLDEKLGAWHDLHVLLEFIREFAGHHSRGHTPYWLPRITRAVVTEQISILESFNASKK